MLRVVEAAHRTDTGRQRTANEDSFFARSPVFAVADGMGGAQAGEVASRTAVETFDPAPRDEGVAPEAYLRAIVEEANGRIHRLAASDSSRAGMGTTLTAVMLDEKDEIAIAHVGDSRAYLWRDGELKRLTSDHSLVEELRREGRLTEEQAEEHPQRSIITRALGPEAQVEVDTMTYRARDGDVYLLCSDGLTTMIKEPRIAEELASGGDLRSITRALVRAANEAGGRDNITVVAFRVGEGTGALEEQQTENATLVGATAASTGAGVQAERSRVAASRPEPRSKRRRRIAIGALVSLVLIAGLLVAGFFGARQVYFLGADDSGDLALYRGLPYDLPFGIELYDQQASTDLAIDDLPDSRRDTAVDHELRSREDAESLIADLEQAAAEAAVETTGQNVGDAGEATGEGSGASGGSGGTSGGAGGNR
ncbi:Stp1/IreP family PP2C-type Ser/Thr phosphatase [Thermoleophilia bacterium SCSIO 60948]|nr:Stp1/IreP family PP2C-type Ser/Thr phosphatase [Thermoleophilia bacterium SCSIO 60948]